jgi:2-aminoethylphosphonate-pyruvate transaminase
MSSAPLVLLTPGPVNVSSTVKAALSGPDLCHREPEWFEIQDEIRQGIVRVLGLDRVKWTSVLLGGGGTAAVEAMITAAPARGKGVVVVDNGVYGDRIARICAAHGMPARRVTAGWLERPGASELEKVIATADDCDTVALVHHETTTGLLNDVESIARIAKRYDKLLVVDAVSSLGGERLDLDACDIDLAACTANKCFQGLPGLAFVVGKRTVFERLVAQPARSVYLNLNDYFVKQERRDTPFTPPVQVAMAFRQALRELEQESVPRRIARYAGYANEFRAGFEEIGLEMLLPAALRSGTITALALPSGVSYAKLHDTLKQAGFVVYGAQGELATRAFRVANIGEIPDGAILRCLAALASVLQDHRR